MKVASTSSTEVSPLLIGFWRKVFELADELEQPKSSGQPTLALPEAA